MLGCCIEAQQCQKTPCLGVWVARWGATLVTEAGCLAAATRNGGSL